MSGIFGALGAVGDCSAETMSHRLRHRGRKSVVVPLTNGGFLGATADEPSACIHVSEKLAIAIDGDILNLAQLSESIANGAEAGIGTSPAEVVLEIFRQVGAEGLENVEGNFAFVIVDVRADEIVFGRDYFGVKPLFCAETVEGITIFASEYKALLEVPGFKASVDVDMLQYLQHSKKLPIGRTLLGNVKSPPPGAICRVNRTGKTIATHQFPALVVKVERRSEQDTIDLLRRELTRSIRRNTSEKGNIGLALSGGIDSIGLAFLLRKLYPDREIHTFSAGSDQNDAELCTARAVAAKIESVHHEVLVPPNRVKGILRDVIWHIEDPYARSEVPQLYEIGRAARGHVKTLLSGQGADSLFAGMPRYRLLWMIKKLMLFRRALEEFYNRTQYGISPKSKIGRLLELVYYRGRPSAVPSIVGASYDVSPQPFPPTSDNFVNVMMAKTFQSGQCQDAMKYERCFAAFGLNYRLPFSDLQFVRFAYSIDDALKIRFRKNKYVLRKALAGIVPDRFLEIPKFAQRVRCDLEFSEVLDSLKDTVLSKSAVDKRGRFDHKELGSLFKRHANRPYTDETSMRLWTAIATELWMEIFVDKKFPVNNDSRDNRY